MVFNESILVRSLKILKKWTSEKEVVAWRTCTVRHASRFVYTLDVRASRVRGGIALLMRGVWF